jgi:hypothetical protein
MIRASPPDQHVGLDLSKLDFADAMDVEQLVNRQKWPAVDSSLHDRLSGRWPNAGQRFERFDSGCIEVE